MLICISAWQIDEIWQALVPMATTTLNTKVQDLFAGPEMANVDSSHLDTAAPEKTLVNDINLDQLFKNLNTSKKEDNTNKSKIGKNWLENKLLDFSKIVFSRESTYRGFIDIFAADIPSLAAAACRNWTYFLEDVVKTIASTSMMFAAPLFIKLMIKLRSKEVFNEEHELKNTVNYMLFSNNDLKDLESFDTARVKITEDEVKDKYRIAELYGLDSKQGQKALSRAKEIKNFMTNYQASDELREKIIKLKDKVTFAEGIVESTFWGLRPLMERLFRRYVLGINRFTGSLKYLSDEEADKLGNQKHFTVTQMMGTVLSIVLSPFLIARGQKIIRDPNKVNETKFNKTMHEQMDLKHGIYPKFGLYAAYSNIPLLISKLFNSQDPFELVEHFVRFCVTFISIFFGDRMTNGVMAKSADKELTEKYGEKPGILYYRNEKTPENFIEKLNSIFPEAAKYQDIEDKTKHNPELQEEATKKYKSTFFKGFFTHSFGSFLIKYGINMLTQFAVEIAKNRLHKKEAQARS